MAEQLLDRVRAQIRARVRELEPAVRESEQLEAANAALDGLGIATPAADTSAPAAAAPTRRRRPSSARRPGGPAKRAPRGANRTAVLGVLAERSGVSASELSSAAGVARPVLYALLKTLEERGEVAKEQLPGGSTGTASHRHRATRVCDAQAGGSVAAAASRHRLPGSGLLEGKPSHGRRPAGCRCARYRALRGHSDSGAAALRQRADLDGGLVRGLHGRENRVSRQWRSRPAMGRTDLRKPAPPKGERPTQRSASERRRRVRCGSECSNARWRLIQDVPGLPQLVARRSRRERV